MQGGEDVCFGVKAVARVFHHWHTAPSPLPLLTLCPSCLVSQFVSISVVHEVGVDSWGIREFESLNISHSRMMHLFRAVRFIFESPRFFTWNLGGNRELIGDKLETGVVPVPVGFICRD